MRDTAEIFDHFPFDEDAVTEQARTALEDMAVGAIKVGFVGTPESLAIIAELADDYDGVPVVAYMPNLSWWEDHKIDAYLDAFRELLLPRLQRLFAALRQAGAVANWLNIAGPTAPILPWYPAAGADIAPTFAVTMAASGAPTPMATMPRPTFSVVLLICMSAPTTSDPSAAMPARFCIGVSMSLALTG